MVNNHNIYLSYLFHINIIKMYVSFVIDILQDIFIYLHIK